MLTDCLNLRPTDVLALFSDETTSDTANIFLEAASELELEVRSRVTPVKDQAAFDVNVGLCSEDREALASARGIITCLSNHVAGTPYRTTLVRTGTNGDTRFGHMPGANLDVLAHAVNIDYMEASSRCDDLALALTLGEKVRLRTYVPGSDEPHDLNFDIGGVKRSPITSTGIIPLGTWGNLPGGETFIAPIEDSANGVFVLNGAFKNYVMKSPTYVLLSFENGRLVHIEGTENEEAAFKTLVDFVRSVGDSFYNSLAELGIGVNRGIKELTGNALFDEKCYGTAHIAIGDNSRFGGLYSSRTHEDLVSRVPSIWIDEKPILDRGKDAFEASQWRESLDNNDAASASLSGDSIIARTNTKVQGGGFGKLRVRRNVSAGRICIYTIGEPATSRTLARLDALIPSLGQYIRFDDLCRLADKNKLELSRSLTAAAVSILSRHDVITVKDQN